MQDDLLVLLGRDDHHGNGRRFVAQVDQAIEPVHAGHVQVEQDQVQVIVFLGQREGTVEVGGFHHLATGKAIADDVVYGFAKQRVIVGNRILYIAFHLIILIMVWQQHARVKLGKGFGLCWHHG